MDSNHAESYCNLAALEVRKQVSTWLELSQYTSFPATFSSLLGYCPPPAGAAIIRKVVVVTMLIVDVVEGFILVHRTAVIRHLSLFKESFKVVNTAA